MIRGIDHVVILVADLAQAVRDYEALGFRVAPGGAHSDGATQNALIGFADGTYLELLAFAQEAPAHRWWRHVAAGEGLIEFALLAGEIEAAMAAAAARGLHLDGPFSGGRERPNGARIQWQSAFPVAPELPFLCGDVTPRDLRVPHGEDCHHPNGITGIGRMSVAVTDIETSAALYAELLGHGPMMEPGRRIFKLGPHYVTLQAPNADLSDHALIEARLAARGPGIASVVLRRDHMAGEPQPLDPALTHGAAIAVA
jgi:catechol 2,3-dioxygenase-like lactoylglutathione lyase family enzyme